MNDVLSATGLYKKYNDNDGYVLKDFSISLKEHEIIALVGTSGCGKSTLLHILGLLDNADSGNIEYMGQNISQLDKPKTICKHFGFVYQFHNLLQEFSAEENVMLPQLINNIPKKTALTRARELLDAFGIADKAKSLPGQLSGGQKQRVAIARAIANSPNILLADEPTGSLDLKTSTLVMQELLKILKDFNISAIIATHSIEIADTLDRKIKM